MFFRDINILELLNDDQLELINLDGCYVSHMAVEIELKEGYINNGYCENVYHYFAPPPCPMINKSRIRYDAPAPRDFADDLLTWFAGVVQINP